MGKQSLPFGKNGVGFVYIINSNETAYMKRTWNFMFKKMFRKNLH